MTAAIKIEIRDHGHAFFTGSPDDVRAEIERLKALPAEQLGYHQDGDDDGVTVVYHVFRADSEMDDASDAEWNEAERIAQDFGTVTFFAPFASA